MIHPRLERFPENDEAANFASLAQQINKNMEKKWWQR
jgi:hypothetical protein